MRRQLAAIVGAYLLANVNYTTGYTIAILQQQCPRSELLLSSVQSCTQEDDGSEIIELLKLSYNSPSKILSSTEGTEKVWISHSTGLAHTGDQPACAPHLVSLHDILCIYVYPSFYNNRGLAIFTTPSLATEFTQRAKAIDSELTSRPDPALNKHSPDYVVTPLPNRGLGAIATTSIPIGTPLTKTTPILIVHSDNTPTFDREKFLRLAVSLLPADTRSAFNGLARIYNDPRVTHQDAIKANSFAIDIAGVQHLAVFPEPSRFNHDCAPNAMYHVDSLALTHTVHATRPIAEGDEITVSYLDPFSPGAARHDFLQSAFGFACSCQRCVEAERDDAQIAEIQRLESILGNWDARESVQWFDYTDMAEDLIDLYQRRGLEGFMNTAFGHAALAYNSVGESGRATMYARKALDVAKIRHGKKGSRAVGVWEEFLEDGAWKHWSWSRRVPVEY